jgi:very-short-patch-repair endonuclease
MRPDDAVQRMLDRQFGVIASWQASDCGLTPAALKHWVRSGRLVRVHRGVFRAPSAAATVHQRAMAGCLAAGPEAVAGRFTAASLFGLVDRAGDVVEVTVPTGRLRSVPGVAVHRAKLLPADTTRIGVIPVLTVPRTLVDLAAVLPQRDLTEAVDRGFRRKLVSPERCQTFVEARRFDRFRGIGVLRTIIDDRVKFGVPDSILESDIIELLREYGLPEPVRQYEQRVNGREVAFDLAYPDHRIAIELDGKVPHTEHGTWQRDHDRHNATELGKWPTLRFTWWDVHERRNYVAITLGDGLGLRPVRWKRVRKSTP